MLSSSFVLFGEKQTTVEIIEGNLQQPILSSALESPYLNLGLEGEAIKTDSALSTQEAYSLTALLESGETLDNFSGINLPAELSLFGTENNGMATKEPSNKTTDLLTGTDSTENLVGELSDDLVTENNSSDTAQASSSTPVMNSDSMSPSNNFSQNKSSEKHHNLDELTDQNTENENTANTKNSNDSIDQASLSSKEDCLTSDKDSSPINQHSSTSDQESSTINEDIPNSNDNYSPIDQESSSVDEDIPAVDQGDIPNSSQPSVKADGSFQVIGSKIYDPKGVEFIAKGVNVPGYRYTWPADTIGDADLITEHWGFNFVRLNNYFFTKAKYPQFDNNNNIDAIIEEYTDRGAVVLVEAHDHLGGFWPKGDLEKLKAKFKDLAERYKDNPYVWFSINEPGGNGDLSFDKWVNQHQEIIQVIRDEVGASNPIVVNAIHWGQDGIQWGSGPVKEKESSILEYGDELEQFDGKTYENIIFDVHLYNNWKYGKGKMEDYFDRVLAKDQAIIVGEYGGGNAWTSATRDMFEVVAPREIGRVAWAWWGGDDNDLTTSKNGGGQHINDIKNPTNLSEMGKLAWKDNRRQEDLETLS